MLVFRHSSCIRKTNVKCFNFSVFWLCHLLNFWKHLKLASRIEALKQSSFLLPYLLFAFLLTSVLSYLCLIIGLCPESSILCGVTNWELDDFEIIWMWFEMEAVKTWNRSYNTGTTEDGIFRVIKRINMVLASGIFQDFWREISVLVGWVWIHWKTAKKKEWE